MDNEKYNYVTTRPNGEINQKDFEGLDNEIRENIAIIIGTETKFHQEVRKMAHECPECGQQCYCGGDIDDCCNNFEEDVINCTHYLQCGTENIDDDEV